MTCLARAVFPGLRTTWRSVERPPVDPLCDDDYVLYRDLLGEQVRRRRGGLGLGADAEPRAPGPRARR